MFSTAMFRIQHWCEMDVLKELYVLSQGQGERDTPMIVQCAVSNVRRSQLSFVGCVREELE